MAERRRAKRKKEKAEVTVSIINPNDPLANSKITHHLTKDISLAGIRIQSQTFIPMNSMIKIELSLGEPASLISALGRVRWVKCLYEAELFEMGIEFVETSREVIRQLKSHIQE
jgi:c-di-GMP-binding flagellar brake protein YcgR